MTNDRVREELQALLARVEGQLRDVQRMIDQDRPCEDILVHVAAVRHALQAAALQLMDDHLQTVVDGGSGAPQDEEIDRLMRGIVGLVRREVTEEP